MKQQKTLLLIFTILVFSNIVYAVDYKIYTTCYAPSCENYPIRIWVYNDTTINSTNITEIEIRTNTSSIPFQWNNDTGRQFLTFFVNQSNNLTQTYVIRTDSGSVHNVSYLFPNDTTTDKWLNNNYRTNELITDDLENYACDFGNCAEVSVSSAYSVSPGKSILINDDAGGDTDRIGVNYSQVRGTFNILFWDNASDNTGFLAFEFRDIGVGDTYPCLVRSASSTTHYAYYNGTGYGVTPVQRTTGWHVCKTIVNSSGITGYIDGVMTNATNFNNINLNLNIDAVYAMTVGGDASTYYFDDFVYSPYGFNMTTTFMNYTLAAPSTDLSLTITDDWNSSYIPSFSVNISWENGSVTTFSTTNGTITLANITNTTQLINVTYWNMTDYFNAYAFNQNITTNLSNAVTTSTFQAVLCLNATEKISDAAVSTVNFTISGVSQTCYNITAGIHNVLAQKTGWFDKNQTFTVIALSNETETVVNLSSANLTIYVIDQHTATYLSNYDITLTSLNYTSWTGENVTSVSNYSYYLINGTYAVSISKSGYATTNASANITVAGHTNYTFYLREANTLNMTVYDETTNTLLTNVNVSIAIIQDNTTVIYYTGNGTLYSTSLTPGEIEIQYDDYNTSGYDGRVYYVTLSNYTYQEVRLYLLNSTLGDLITFDLVDQDGQDLEGAIVKAQRFYPAENMYRTVAMTKSNFNGQGSIDLVKKATQANVFYKFIVEVDGEVKEETDATEINPVGADILYFTVDVLESIFTSWDGMENVEYSLINGTSAGTPYFSFTWSDTTGLTQYGCLNVVRHTPLGETVICNNCTTSTAATIVCNITNDGKLYKAAALIETTTNHSLYTVAVLDWNFDNKSATFGQFGVFLAFILIGTMAAIGLWNPVVSVVLCLVGLVFSAIIGMISITYITVISLVIVGGIIIAKSRT